MLLKLVYKFRNEPMEIETNYPNYKFGIARLYNLFYQKHGKTLDELVQEGIVTDDGVYAYYGGNGGSLSELQSAANIKF